MSDTPRTDARVVKINRAMKRPDDAPMMLESTCRQLEREFTAAKEENERITALHSESQYEHSIEVASLSALLEKAEAERDALRVDAERYRHVRARPEMLLHLSNKQFDAAIDSAMKGASDDC